MTTADQGSTCWIRSTLDPDTRKAACLLEWGPITALLTPQAVLDTARDLAAAAAHAETDIALLRFLREELRADDQTAGHLLLAVRKARPLPPRPAALRIETVAGAKTGRPYVHIARGSMLGRLDPDEARQMAQHWTEAAVAAQIDVRLRYALGEFDHLTEPQIDALFAKLQAVQR